MIDLSTLHSRFNIRDGIKTRKLNYTTVWDNHGLIIYSGKQGSGKTLSIVRQVNEWKRKNPLLTIVSNMPLDLEYIPYSFEKMLELDEKEVKGIVLILDEIANCFLSNLDRIDPKWQALLDMMRKRELVILGSLPNYCRAHKLIKEKANNVCICKNYFRVFQVNSYYEGDEDKIAVSDDTQEILKSLKRVKLHYFFHSLDDYKRYNTTNIIRRSIDDN